MIGEKNSDQVEERERFNPIRPSFEHESIRQRQEMENNETDEGDDDTCDDEFFDVPFENSEDEDSLSQDEVKKNQKGIRRYPFDEGELLGNFHSGNCILAIMYDSIHGIFCDDTREHLLISGLQWYSPFHKSCFNIQSKKKLFFQLKSLAGRLTGIFACQGLAVDAYYKDETKFGDKRMALLRWVGRQLDELKLNMESAIHSFTTQEKLPSRLELFFCFGNENKRPEIKFNKPLQELMVVVQLDDIVQDIKFTREKILGPLHSIFFNPWLKMLQMSAEAKCAAIFLMEQLNARSNLTGFAGSGRITKAMKEEGATMSNGNRDAFTTLTSQIDRESRLPFGIRKRFLSIPLFVDNRECEKFRVPSSVLAEVAKLIDKPELYSKMFFMLYKRVLETYHHCPLQKKGDDGRDTTNEPASILDAVDWARLAAAGETNLLKLKEDMARILVRYYREASFHVHVSKHKRIQRHSSDLHLANWREVPEHTVALSEFIAKNPNQSYFELSRKQGQLRNPGKFLHVMVHFIFRVFC
jgi:hypothetical protein